MSAVIPEASQSHKSIFAEFQPKYAEHGVATFPVGADKRPLVKGYCYIGVNYSAQLPQKFANSDAFGFVVGKPSGITIVDVDSQDETILEAALERFGSSKLIVKTGGGYHAYYRHNGEGRRIRLYDSIDILGIGFAVAAPSITQKGQYRIIQGQLDDLRNLRPMQGALACRARNLSEGIRNSTLFRCLLGHARHVDDFNALLDVARTINMDCVPMLPDSEVVKVAKSAWGYEISGKNWVGRKARASTDRDEILAFSGDPHAALLLNLLRVSHPAPDKEFAICQVEVAKLLQWNERTIAKGIEALIERKCLERTHIGKGKGNPHLYRLAHRWGVIRN